MARKIFLLRHCLTSDSENHINGSRRDTPLSENGQKQAIKLITELSKHHYDVVFVSPLVRTQQTIQPYLDSLKDKPPVIIDDLLTERDIGIFTGTKETVEGIAREVEKSGKSRVKWVPEGGESTQMCHVRAVEFLKKIKDRQEQNILICAHQNILRNIELALKGLPLTDKNYYSENPPRQTYAELRLIVD